MPNPLNEPKMPSLIQAFRALRPGKNTADRVIAPPYDVVSTAEARKLVAGRPVLHVLSDQDPGNGFVPAQTTLEDVFFTSIAGEA